MLSQKDLSLLYQIISDDNQTFEKISQSYQNNFKKENQVNVGTTLFFLLKDNLLNMHQRIISIYILYEMSKNDKNANTYIPIILEILQNNQNKNEHIFIMELLSNSLNCLNLTIRNYLNDNSKVFKTNNNKLQMQWDKFYEDKMNIYLKINDKYRPIIYDRKKMDIKNIDNHYNLNLLNNDKDNNIEKELNLNYFNPNYMSYYPINNNNFINSEPIWLLPSLKHNFIWDKKDINNKK